MSVSTITTATAAEPTHASAGRMHAADLLRYVRYQWFGPNVSFLFADRPGRTWEDTIADAYDAHLGGEGTKQIALPDGVDIDGRDTDAASEILENLNGFLGRNAVWDVLDDEADEQD